MTLMISTMLVTILASTMFMATNTLSLGLLILTMALLIALTFACSMSSWIAFLIFLIYIGGMLVMFAYFVSLIPNQKIKVKRMYKVMTAMTMATLGIFYFYDLTPLISTDQPQLLNTLYTTSNMALLITLATILLFTMIVTVKLTFLTKGPLRPFSTYV